MYWLYTYLGGMALKSLFLLASNVDRPSGKSNFTETILWPFYLVFDVFMFFASFWFDDA